MRLIKRFFIALVLLDNLLTNLPKKLLFKSRWKLTGQCKQCGVCCQEILLKMTPRQISSKFFTKLAIRWTSWLFDFILLRVDYEHQYLVFTCHHTTKSGKCGNYFWRPNVCRNYPIIDYFDKPRFLPNCGFSTTER